MPLTAVIRYQVEPDFAVGQVVDQLLPETVAITVTRAPSGSDVLTAYVVPGPVRRFAPAQAGVIVVEVGLGVGVGAGVGVAVGTAVGAGVRVGVAVGTTVAVAVGVGVGVGVGLHVVAAFTTPPPPPGPPDGRIAAASAAQAIRSAAAARVRPSCRGDRRSERPGGGTERVFAMAPGS